MRETLFFFAMASAVTVSSVACVGQDTPASGAPSVTADAGGPPPAPSTTASDSGTDATSPLDDASAPYSAASDPSMLAYFRFEDSPLGFSAADSSNHLPPGMVAG